MLILQRKAGIGTLQLATFGGTPGDGIDRWGKRVEVDSTGTPYFLGVVNNGGRYNTVLTKGNLQWQRQLDINLDYDRRINMAIDSTGNIYYVANNRNPTLTDAVIVKYNSAGVLQWQRILAGSQHDTFNGIAIDSSDNIIVSGTTKTSSGSPNYLLVAKYNSAGTLQFQRRISGMTTTSGYNAGCALDSSGNIYVTGVHGGIDDYFMKLNTGASAVTFGRKFDFSAETIRMSPTDDVYIGGWRNGVSMVVKFDTTSGNDVWKKSYPTGNSEGTTDIAFDSSSNIYPIINRRISFSPVRTNLHISKMNSSGTTLWSRLLGKIVNTNIQAGGIWVYNDKYYVIARDDNESWFISERSSDGSGIGTIGTEYEYTNGFSSSDASMSFGAFTYSSNSSSLTNSISSFSEFAGSLISTNNA